MHGFFRGLRTAAASARPAAATATLEFVALAAGDSLLWRLGRFRPVRALLRAPCCLPVAGVRLISGASARGPSSVSFSSGRVVSASVVRFATRLLSLSPTKGNQSPDGSFGFGLLLLCACLHVG